MDEHTQPAPWPGPASLAVVAGVVTLMLLLVPAFNQASPAALAAKTPWYLSRAAGVTAYLLLSASTLLGLAISTRVLDGRVSRAGVFTLHEHLSWLALGFVGLHAGALLFDTYEPFNLAQLLIPFASSYRPLAVGLGVLGLYLLGLLVASFYVRARLGQRTWRAFHYASFGLYVLATLHGVFAGNGTGDAWMQWLYLASGGAVLLLTNYRILLTSRARHSQRMKGASEG